MTPEEKVALLKEAGVWDVIGFPGCIDKLIDLVAKHERNRHAWTQEHWTEYEHAIAAAAREACAKVCEELKVDPSRSKNKTPDLAYNLAAHNCAAAIREIGGKEMIVETLTKALTALKSCRYVSDRHSEIYGQQEYTEMDVDEAIEAIESCFKFMQNKLDMNSDPVDAFNAGYEDARNSYQSEIAFAVEAAVLAEREKQAEHEPVAIVNHEAGGSQKVTWLTLEGLADGAELYLHPVRTKDLSDDEIADALYGKGCWRLGVHPVHLREYRRVIQADRELNK